MDRMLDKINFRMIKDRLVCVKSTDVGSRDINLISKIFNISLTLQKYGVNFRISLQPKFCFFDQNRPGDDESKLGFYCKMNEPMPNKGIRI